jgi:hypothetical protein
MPSKTAPAIRRAATMFAHRARQNPKKITRQRE